MRVVERRASKRECWAWVSDEAFSPVSKERFAEGLEFSLSRLDDSGSLALRMILSFLESWYSFLRSSSGAEGGL